MQYSLDQRRYNLNMTAKQLCEECNRRGRKISYTSVCSILKSSSDALYQTEKKVTDTLADLELEAGITDLSF